jgi:hypothetical protein
MIETSIFIKTYSADRDFLEYCLLSIKKFASNYKEIVIVSDDNFSFFKHGLNIKFLVIKPKNWHTAFKYHHNGYFNQMIEKMQCLIYCNSDRAFIIDSDQIFTSPIDISALPNIWSIRHWDTIIDTDHYRFWKPSVDYYYKKPTLDMMCGPGFIYTRELQNKFWSNAMLNYFISSKTAVSEFQMMGNYLYCVNQLDYRLQPCQFPIRQYWSYGGISKVKDEILKLLK